MAAASIVRRATKSGDPRFHVRFQAGYHEAQIHLGVFKTLADAKRRAAWGLSEWASGRIPDRHSILRRSETSETLRQVAADYLAARIDAKDSSRQAYEQRLRHALAAFGHLAPAAVTPKMVKAWTVEQTATAAPRSVRSRVSALRQLLDHAGVNPNPCRDQTVRMPRNQRREIVLPNREQIRTILAEVPPQHAEPIRLMEAGGFRIHEVLGLVWADVDADRGRVRVRDSKTAAGRRFVTLDELPARPPDARDDARLYYQTDGAIRSAIARVCQRHAYPRFSPHAFRHLHASRLLHAGHSPAEISARIGHANPAITLGLYSHVVPPD